MTKPRRAKDTPSIGELYPRLSKKRRQVAETNLKRYAELTFRMAERLCRNPEAYARFKALTPPQARATMDHKRSNPKNDSNTQT